MLKPNSLRNSCIGPAESAGRAVNTKTLSVPFLSAMIFATSNKGPFWPFITLLNSEKSHLAPNFSNALPSFANVAASILYCLGSFGKVYNTLLFVLAKVSSKSNTRILLTDLENATF